MKALAAVGRAVAFSLLWLAAAAGGGFGEGVDRSDSAGGVAVAVDGGSYTSITPLQLERMLRAEDFFLVNTHIPYQGEIGSTDAFIPFDRTGALLSSFPADRGAKIVLYCRSGRMSDIAARVLVKAGYANIYDLAGGMNAWQQAGLPLEDAGGKQ